MRTSLRKGEFMRRLKNQGKTRRVSDLGIDGPQGQVLTTTPLAPLSWLLCVWSFLHPHCAALGILTLLRLATIGYPPFFLNSSLKQPQRGTNDCLGVDWLEMGAARYHVWEPLKVPLVGEEKAQFFKTRGVRCRS